MRPPTPDAADLIPKTAPPGNSSQAGAINWKKYRRLALPLSLLAGVGIVFLLPYGALLFVGVVVFTVGRYSREHQGPLFASQGAKMGAFNGLISFIVLAAATVLQMALNFEDSHRQFLLEFQRRFAGNSDPIIQRIAHLLPTNLGFVTFMILGLVFFLVIFLIVSSFIGAISVSLSANRNRR